MPFKKILVPFDGSAAAIAALGAAAQMARHSDAKLAVLNVAEILPLPAAPTAEAFLKRGMEEVQELELKKAAVVLRRLKAKALFVSAAGHPVDAVVKYARKGKFDLIVMGSKGRSGLQQMLLGSVSEGVIRHAHCAVLVVRKE